MHPFLISLFPVFSLYSYNIDQVDFLSFAIAFGISLSLAAILFYISWYLYKNSEKAGFMATSILFVFFLYGHVHTYFLDRYARMFTQEAIGSLANAAAQYDIRLHAYLLIISSFFIAVVAIAIKNTKDNRDCMTRIFNLMSLFLLIFPTFVIVEYKLKEPSLISLKEDKEKSTFGNAPEIIERDIYFIVLDGYARCDVLREFYDFDNTAFINYLKQKGFFVASRSHSNYAWTHLSLPSMLNFEYVNYLSETIGEYSRDLQTPFKMIENNRAVQYLKSQGYYFVFFNSTWRATKSNKYADLSISYDKAMFSDEYLRVLAQTTMLKLFNSIVASDLAEWHLYNFKMGSVIKSSQFGVL